MTKQLLLKSEWQLSQLSFVLFSGLEEEFWCQLKLNGKIATLFYCADGFHFWAKMFNFDTTTGKICISRPLGTTPVKSTWLIRQKLTGFTWLPWRQHLTKPQGLLWLHFYDVFSSLALLVIWPYPPDLWIFCYLTCSDLDLLLPFIGSFATRYFSHLFNLSTFATSLFFAVTVVRQLTVNYSLTTQWILIRSVM